MRSYFRIACMFLFLLAAGNLHAQHTITGKLVDDEGGSLPSGTVMLQTAKDSVLQSFALSTADGTFTLKLVPEGSYILIATFGQFEPLSMKVEVPIDKKVIDLGELTIVEKSSELGTVEISDELIPIRIKGDTLEFTADAFKTQPNASVEELLKRLPGMEVDKSGNVKAQGEDVTRVLVDGKEFFGNDPKMATKNLPADAIDKVQIFDKRSDMADFTGVDDGDLSKTINLTLKADRKNGFFGDIGGGYGNGDGGDHRFKAKTNLNRFSDKAQLSFLGMGNNINEQAFSIQDYVNFMGGMGNLMSGGGFGRGGSGGGLSPSDLGISWRGSGSQSSGINTSAAGGVNYNVDLSKKTELQSSYFYNFMRIDLQESSYRENFLQENTFITEDSSDQLDKNQNHRLNLRIKHEIDSSAQLIFTGSGRLNSTNGWNASGLQSISGALLQNSSFRTENSAGGSYNVASNLLYMKKFGKRGRSMTLQGSLGGLQNQNKDLDVYSPTFVLNRDPAEYDTLDQNQAQDQFALNYGGKITYTEPLGRRTFLELLYAHEETQQDVQKDFWDRDEAGLVFNDTLSSRYDGIYRFDQPRANFRYVTKKNNISVGLAGQRTQLDGVVGLQDTSIEKVFYNLLPAMSWRYNIKKGSNIRLNYDTRVNAPSIEQLQPVPDNSNPLSVYIGNPDLNAEWAHTARLRYMIFDQFSFTSLFTMLSATYTKDKISQSTQIDSLFRQTQTFENVDYDVNLRWVVHFSTPIRKLKVKVNFDPNVSYAKSITLLNDQENLTNRITSTLGGSIENRKKEHFDLRVGAKLTHNLTQYTIGTTSDQTYLNTQYYTDFTWYFPKGWTFNTTFDYYVYSGGGLSEDQTIPLLSAYLSKTFLKNDRGEFRLYGFDLLNQNKGIDRTTSINYWEESRYNTLSRYAMLSFTYKIIRIGKGK